MKRIIGFFKNKVGKAKKLERELNRKELEKKAVIGAQKAVKEYRRVFERLAEYDRN